ncbi:MAG: heme-dependent oxidative N-demethylase family protein [Marinibacterium sp.]
MTAICQTRLPYDPRPGAGLPGVRPMDMADWLVRDEAFAAQMAERDRLLRERRADVLAMDHAARLAAEELLDLVLDQAYRGSGPAVQRPDGVSVDIDRGDPMGTLGRLVQEDLCILEKRQPGEHVLTAAVLCFPASWRLDEKFRRPLTRIHAPVADYDDNIARRVQRLFDGIRPGRPLWRFNALLYEKPDLFQPLGEGDLRPHRETPARTYFRSERQCLVRLPVSGAVVFSIHTYVIPAHLMPPNLELGHA